MTSSTLTSVTLPYNWQSILTDQLKGQKEEGVNCWCNIYEPNKNIVYDTLTPSKTFKTEADINFPTSLKLKSDINVNWNNKLELDFQLPNPIKINSYKKIYETNIKKSNHFQLSPHKELVVVGGNDGALHIYDTKDFTLLRDLQGHFGDVEHCQFFPSSQVILSAASDFQLKIWSALDGSNPVTLKGHTRGVTNTQIIGRGWNVLSTSLDGTLKLWECGTSKIIRDYKPEGRSSTNWASLLQEGATIDKYTAEASSQEGAKGHCVLTCHADGSFNVFDLNAPEAVLTHRESSTPLNRSTFLTKSQSQPQFVTGDIEGNIHLRDLRAPSKIIYSAKKDHYSITSLVESGETTVQGPKLVVGHKDGSISDLIATPEGFKLVGQKFLNELYGCVNVDVGGTDGSQTWGLDGSGKIYVF